MTHSADDIDKFHRALKRLCNMEALSPSMSDQRAWHDFLLEMKPLEESEGGPFTLSDLTAVLSEMRRQLERGIAKWSMRPTTILREPERFRDMVEEARRGFRMSKRVSERPPERPAIQHLPTGTNRLTDDNVPDPEATTAWDAAAAELAALRRKAGLTSP